MSRQELAELVNAYLLRTAKLNADLDGNYVGKLERGVHRWPGAAYRQAFRAILNAATDAELGFYITGRTRAARRGASAARPVGVAATVTGLPHLTADAAGGHLLLRDGHLDDSAAVDPAIIEHFAALRATLVRSDDLLGATVVLPAVLHQLGVVAQFRRKTRGRLHEALLRTEARWAEFAGWLCDDLGDRPSGTWWISQSMTMAQESNDLDFLAYLLARMAQRAAEGPDEDRVLSMAEAAGRITTASTPVRAFAALQRARGHAASGETHQFQAAIGEARTLVEDQATRYGDLGSFCIAPYVVAHEGDGWLRLNRPKAAVKRLGDALTAWPASFQRDKGLFLSRAAAARLAHRQPDQAAVTAIEALKVADSTRSMRIVGEVTALGQQLVKFGNRPATAALLAKLAQHTQASP